VCNGISDGQESGVGWCQIKTHGVMVCVSDNGTWCYTVCDK
jgi:hypothetical protein